jgi:hypothetical protein
VRRMQVKLDRAGNRGEDEKLHASRSVTRICRPNARRNGFGSSTIQLEGRSARRLAWNGIANTFFRIDPKSDRCAVLLMQFLPFNDKQTTGSSNDRFARPDFVI